MSNSDFKTRNKTRIAEPAALSYLEKNNIPYIRSGLDHLDSNLPIWNIPSFIRAMPDYIIFNDRKPMFFEAKGFKCKVKLKIRDLKNYRKWNEYLEISFFLFDIVNESYTQITFQGIVDIVIKHQPIIKSYPESKENTYYEMEPKWFPLFKTI